MALLEMPDDITDRYLNVGFSGGEKKRNEVLQMLMLQPKLAILDEIDSGLDIDALRIVAKGINHLRGPKFSALLITHYERLLRQTRFTSWWMVRSSRRRDRNWLTSWKQTAMPSMNKSEEMA